jgi:predicted nucleotidyltransferase component of viral defense system
MKIENVIDESILAVFHDPVLARRMFLKGGSAMRMLDEERARLSLDADFSIQGSIRVQKSFFARVEKSLSHQFKPRYCVFDFLVTQRPKQRKPDQPKWWKGWLCRFKLIETAHADLPLEAKRRRALIPEGSNSSVIEIEISEHEYCGAERTKLIRGVLVHGYTRELLVVEKLRAICQQHPEYRFRSNKNRARDFYDIYKLCSGRDPSFFISCRQHLPAVFAAKDVPVSLLKALWDEDFLSVQRSGFTQVKDSTKGAVRDFDVYVEYLRYLVGRICPEVSPAENRGASQK